MIWMTGLVRPSRSTSGNISFCTALTPGTAACRARPR
jgi:hypothetical protein